jgi:hypothetical protein
MRAGSIAALGVVLLSGCTGPLETAESLEITVTDASGATRLEEWGAWSAMPGDRLVESATFLRLSGEIAIKVHVSFLEDVFTGTSDPAWTVPLGSNVEFATWVVPASARCGSVAAPWSQGEDGGVVALRLEPGRDACIAYRVLEIPSPLPSQDYRARYEVVS